MAAQENTPVLHGEIYCSPRCGMKCKKADFDQAHVDADALTARLGEGWEPHVWENWGWKWSVDKGGCSISRHYPEQGYMLMWNLPVLTSPNSKMVVTPQIILNGPDPEDLIGLAKQDARTFIARIAAELEEIG